MVYVYQCIKRSRIAKHAVLERLLLRKVSDGQWAVAGNSVPSKLDVMPAIDLLKRCRERLNQLDVKRNMGTEKLLEHFPELVVCYDYSRGVHCVEFHVQSSMQP